jgi:hypothetical protein
MHARLSAVIGATRSASAENKAAALISFRAESASFLSESARAESMSIEHMLTAVHQLSRKKKSNKINVVQFKYEKAL